MITIHNFARGARGLRVIWLCEEMGLPYRVETVSFPPGPSYLALNPLGTVPFLDDPPGVAFNESIAMLLYVARRYGPTPLLPGEQEPAFARVLQFTVFSETTLGAGMNPLMDAHFGAPEPDKKNWSVRTQTQRVEKALQFLSDQLGTAPYLAGSQPTLADLAVTTTLGIWRGALGRTPPDNLVAYRERLMARPAYQRALKANDPA